MKIIYWILARINTIFFLIYNIVIYGKRVDNFKNILLIRLDLIGDYFLFRNFLEHFRNTVGRDARITLIGNIVWKDVALEFDAKFIDAFIWINPNKLIYNPYKTIILMRYLRKRGFDTVINPAFSRTELGDAIAMATRAHKRVVNNGDLSNIRKVIKKYYDKRYSQIINTPNSIVNEFQKNKFFFEKLTSSIVNFKKPYLYLDNCKCDISGKFLVLVAGASYFPKRWDINKFVALTKNILDEYKDFKIVLTGSNAENYLMVGFKELLENPRVINKIGKTNLLELIYLIRGSKLIIANDTAAIHIAASLEIPSICILGGGHFGRFIPYEEDTNTPVSIFNKMDCYGCNWNCIYGVKISGNKIFPCVSEISTQQVLTASKKILSQL